jgi:FkbM family methyltransferase
MGLRSLAEKLSRGITLRRRLPRQFGGGRIFVAPQAGGLRVWGFDLLRTDPTLFSFVDEFVKPGMSVWDIGANMGLLTFAAASRAGAGGLVLAVEPDIDNVSLLLRTNRHRGATCAPVSILPAAVGAQGQRVAEFQIAGRSRSANALAGFGGTQSGGFLESRSVPLFSLDDLLDSFRKPDVVKIDIEGAEIVALRSATRLLTEVRPIITVEVDPDDKHRREVAAIFKEHRYRLFDSDVPQPERREMELPAWNCLALPS